MIMDTVTGYCISWNKWHAPGGLFKNRSKNKSAYFNLGIILIKELCKHLDLETTRTHYTVIKLYSRFIIV